ncbi:spore coat protein U domain-containing protein [Rhodanobacter sp. FDAARGOS 1247]|jgi:spore coat protein U-like protein|uniref:spore coat protein U domain-containing protein n=1 Tax=Rhodanobacter sp. FDAARGOS 1247 TaxID=2778082 RepID=UPI00195100D3|nr:spore coat protein U domain-containing protein [Rhodanobacter sp. FDAARGOS 1247]QRP63632.1 spore coat protein U domain-containing protein [Rhodanobacter sp. FDAARGOS 1247]
MMLKKSLLAAALFTISGFALTANAATSPITATNKFTVQMIVNKTCKVVVSATTINIGAAAGVDADAAASTLTGNGQVINVNCSKGTGFNVGLTPQNVSSTTGLGTMKGAIVGNTDQPTYQLNQSSSGTAWGNIVNTNTESGTGLGMGAAKTIPLTVYATAASADFTPDTYTDTVSVNVTF